jgi:RimJ/RimL family protein N-acetyltransferase
MTVQLATPTTATESSVTMSLAAGRTASVTSTNWRQQLPVLTGAGITLRELRMSDAPALLALLTTEEVTRFISPPPSTVEGFQRFIDWAANERRSGQYACFAVVPDGYDTAVGIFQVRQLDPTFGTAEWGFAIGSAFWGSGLFTKGAALALWAIVSQDWYRSKAVWGAKVN